MTQRWFAFLRAINVGGHSVKMDFLRQQFVALGFERVDSFIASGNLIFDAGAGAEAEDQALTSRIESGLKTALGYETAVFLRRASALAALAAYQPFEMNLLGQAAALNIAFLNAPLDDPSKAQLLALQTEIDLFHVHGREIFWLCRKKQSESTFSNLVLEKAIGQKTTLRGKQTIQRLAERYLHQPALPSPG